jgi:hypothetical protein
MPFDNSCDSFAVRSSKHADSDDDVRDNRDFDRKKRREAKKKKKSSKRLVPWVSGRGRASLLATNMGYRRNKQTSVGV